MKKIFTNFLWVICFFTLSIPSFAQTVTFPINDIADNRDNVYAFTNAKIQQSSTVFIDNGTLVIKGNKILAVGKNVTIPSNAVVIDLKGKYVYPSFIESYSNYGMPDVKSGRNGNYYNFNQEAKKGAFHWNQAIQPETSAGAMFSGNAKQAETMRAGGFGTAISHVRTGIARGTGVLVALTNEADQTALIADKVSNHFSFSKGTSTNSYPNSMMGSVALLRQTYYDSQWYAGQGEKTEFNLAYDAFNKSKNLPQVFEAGDKMGILRADKIGDEFGQKYIITGGGDEYQRAAEIKKADVPLILPLNFPDAYDVEDIYDAEKVSLAEMKHWELAPTNPSKMVEMGIPFAISAFKNKKNEDFWANIRKAIEYGLSETEALKALTETPAKLFNLQDILGDLNQNKLANLLITDGKIFDKNTKIYENWVKGKRFILQDINIKNIVGKYAAQLDNETYTLTITGTNMAPEAKLMTKDSTEMPVKITRTGDFLNMRFTMPNSKIESRVLAMIANNQLNGKFEKSPGTLLNFVATNKNEIEASKTAPKPAAELNLGKIYYPFVGHGAETIPQSQNLLIKNATVWTNEAEGILVNMDVLVEDGKIKKVGKNLNTTTAQVIDGTGKHLTNGIIDEHSHIALYTINEGGQSVSAEVRTSDVLDPEDIDIYRQLAGGTTSAQLLHGSANSIGGQSSIIKFKWGQSAENLLIPYAKPFIKFALGENVTRKGGQSGNFAPRYPLSRMGVEQVMMDAFTKAKAYDVAWQKYNTAKVKNPAEMPRKDLELETLAEIINKKRFITCHSYVQSEINMMMKVAENFGFKVNTFTHILEGYKVADIMAKHGAGGSSFSDWWAYKMEVRDAIPYNGAMMHKAGVTVAINSDDAEMARRLNQEAAKTVLYGGLSEEEAWKTVTLNPAKLLYLDEKLGSIKSGKDADLVLWNNNPLSIYAKPIKTIIEGAIYFDAEIEETKQKALETERNRIIQKMLSAKASGAPTRKATGPKHKIHDCNDDTDGHQSKF